jgi:hypothetical protein
MRRDWTTGSAMYARGLQDEHLGAALCLRVGAADERNNPAAGKALDRLDEIAAERLL